MKVLELQLPEQTASKLQEAAERLSVSPKQLSILSIEEKLAQLEDEFRRSAEYVLQKSSKFREILASVNTHPISQIHFWRFN